MDTLFTLVFIIGCIGVWYFIKKNPNKKNRNISIGLIIVSAIIVGITSPSQEKVANEDESTTTSSTTRTSSSGTLSSAELAASIEESHSKEKDRIEQSQSREEEAKKIRESEEAEAQRAQESKDAEKLKNSDITILADEATTEQRSTLDELAMQQFDKSYPYKGSKLHIVLGRIQDWTQKDGKWYAKFDATIVNAFDAERKANVEVTIEPASSDSGYVSFLDY